MREKLNDNPLAQIGHRRRPAARRAGVFAHVHDGRRRRRRRRTGEEQLRRRRRPSLRSPRDCEAGPQPLRRRSPGAVAAAPAAPPRRRHRRLRRRTRPSSCSSSATAASTTAWSRAARRPSPRASATSPAFVVPADQDRPLRGDRPGGRRQPRAGSGRACGRSGSTRPSPPPRSATASRARESVVQAVIDAGYKGRDPPLPPVTMDAQGLPEPPAPGPRLRRLDRPGARSRGGRHARPDPADRPAAAPAASSPTSSSTSASSPTTAPGRRSKRRAPPAARPSSCCSSRGRSTPTSSRARSPSATASTTSTSPPTRSTWRRRT